MTCNSSRKSASEWRSQQIEQVSIAELKPFAGNARTHSKKQIAQLTAAIHEFGFIAPVVIDRDNTILSGHARIEAAKQLNWTTISAIRAEHLTEAKIRAYIIADNRLAEHASWDKEVLAQELQYLVDISYEVEITGFESAAIDMILVEATSGEAEDAICEDEAVHGGPQISQTGDLWLLGSHKLLCGDARHAKSYESLLGTERAQMVFTDPPYNVPIKGHVTGRESHGEFVMASGEMTNAAFERDFLAPVFEQLVAFTDDGSIHFICMDWRHTKEMLAASQASYRELKNICVWSKSNGGMGSLYRSQHEFVFVWKSGRAPHINNVELGRHGRNRTNVWHYPGANSFGADRDAELSMHPTVKPVALVADAILDCSKRGGLILDPFAGSGTSIIAADHTGRRAAAMELDPRYVDTAIRRWQSETGQSAIHAVSGLSFCDLEKHVGTGPSIKQPSADGSN